MSFLENLLRQKNFSRFTTFSARNATTKIDDDSFAGKNKKNRTHSAKKIVEVVLQIKFKKLNGASFASFRTC